MGLLDVFRGRVSSTSRGAVFKADIALGKTVLAGSSKYGTDEIFGRFIRSAQSCGQKILIVRGGYNNFSALSSVYASNPACVYPIDVSQAYVNARQMDLFDIYCANEKIQQITDVVSKYCDLEPKTKMLVSKYIETIGKLNGNAVPSIEELVNFDIDRLDIMNANYSVYNQDGKILQLFLDGVRRSDYFYIHSALSEVSNSAFGKSISGKNGLKRLMIDNDVVEVTLNSTDEKGSSAFLYSLCKYFMKLDTGTDKYLIILDGLTTEQYKECKFVNLLSCSRIQVVYSIQDVKGMVNNGGNEWLEKTDTIVFFRQTSPENMTFAADKLGKYETVQIEENRGVSHPKTLLGNIFGVYSWNKQQIHEGWNKRNVEKYYFRPEEFGTLAENEGIVFISAARKFSRFRL